MIFERIGGSIGSELLCKLRSGGNEASGKALLETNEIIVRGDVRVKIPFVSLKSVIGRDGELHLQWPEGSAVLEVGDYAEKWAHKILHPKSRTGKLVIRRSLLVSLLGIADDRFAKELRASAASFSDTKTLKDSDLIFFGAEKAANLARTGKSLHRSLARAHSGSSIPKANRRSLDCR